MKLPAKPSDFECHYAGMYWKPTIDCPKQLPKSAKYVAFVEWSWSPWHSRQDNYYLSTNESRTHWILWNSFEDDNDTSKLIYYPYAYGPRNGVPAKTAAAYLLLAGWKGEMAEYESDFDEPFHSVGNEGLLSVDELILQREFSHLGFLLFRFSNLRVRLRWEQ